MILMKRFILLIAAVIFVFAGATATKAMSKGENNAISLDTKVKIEAGTQNNSDVKALKKGGKDIQKESEAGTQDNSDVKALKKGGKDVKNLDKKITPSLTDEINGGTVK